MPTNKLIEFAEKYFYTKIGLIFGFIAISVTSILLGKILLDDNDPLTIIWIAIVVFCIAYFIIWYKLNFFVPYLKNKKSTSVILLFKYESKELENKFYSDVIEKIEKLILDNDLHNLIHIVIPKSYEVIIMNRIIKDFKKNEKSGNKKIYNYPLALESFERFLKAVHQKKHFGILTKRARRYKGLILKTIDIK